VSDLTIPVPSAIAGGSLVVVSAEHAAAAAFLVRKMAPLSVSSATTLARADGLVQDARRMLAAAEASRKDVKAPLLVLGRQIDAAAKGFLEPLEKAMRELQGRILAFQRQEEARERSERAAADAARAAEKKAQEGSQAARAELVEAVLEGKPIDGAALEAQAKTPAVPAPGPVLTAARSSSTTTRETWDVVIECPLEAVPLVLRSADGAQEFRPWTFDRAALVRALRAGAVVPGCRLVKDEKPVGRRA
jgi:hypothetical protein